MDTIFTGSENLHYEPTILIPQHPHSFRKAYRVSLLEMRVRKGVNNCMGSVISNAGFNNYQNLRAMQTIDLVCVGMKSFISYSLAVPSNQLHGCGVGVKIVIRDPPRGPWSPCCGPRDALMSRYHHLDPVQWFQFAKPWPVHGRHDEWQALVGEHGDVKFCLLLPQSKIDFAQIQKAKNGFWQCCRRHCTIRAFLNVHWHGWQWGLLHQWIPRSLHQSLNSCMALKVYPVATVRRKVDPKWQAGSLGHLDAMENKLKLKSITNFK